MSRSSVFLRVSVGISFLVIAGVAGFGEVGAHQSREENSAIGHAALRAKLRKEMLDETIDRDREMVWGKQIADLKKEIEESDEAWKEANKDSRNVEGQKAAARLAKAVERKTDELNHDIHLWEQMRR